MLVQSAGENYLLDAGESHTQALSGRFSQEPGRCNFGQHRCQQPDADRMGIPGPFDAFEVSTLYLSDGPKETVTFSAFLHSSVGDEGSVVVESCRDADGVGRHAGGCYRPSYAQALLRDQR